MNQRWAKQAETAGWMRCGSDPKRDRNAFGKQKDEECKEAPWVENREGGPEQIFSVGAAVPPSHTH